MTHRVLQPLQPSHLRLNRARRRLVLDGQTLEVLRALFGRRHVVRVRRVEVALQLFDEALERETEDIVLLRILILDLLAIRFELLRATRQQRHVCHQIAACVTKPYVAFTCRASLSASLNSASMVAIMSS